MSRVWLRAAALALVVAGTIAGLTIYFSTETVPRCLVSGAGTWRAPKDGKKHRYEVVVLKEMNDAVRRADNIINEMMVFSESGDLKLSPVQVASVIDAALQPFVENGWLVHEGRRLRLTREGMLMANEVMAVFV